MSRVRAHTHTHAHKELHRRIPQFIMGFESDLILLLFFFLAFRWRELRLLLG